MKNLERLNSTIYKFNPKDYEMNDDDYTFRIDFGNSKDIICFDLKKIIGSSNYLNSGKHYQKDVDIVVVDLKEKIVFLIEVKKASSSATMQDVLKQCISSEKWLTHIFSILEVIEEFKILYFRVLINTRRTFTRKFEKHRCENTNKIIYKTSGNEIPYKALKHGV